MDLGYVIAFILSWLPAGSDLASSTVLDRAASRFAGFGLGMAVLVILMAALLYALAAAGLAASGRKVPRGPGWAGKAILVVALIGLGIALYLTYVETRQVAAICGPVGDCNAVQSSPYARLFGVLPVGLLGAVGYTAIVAAWAVGRYNRGTLAIFAPLAVFAIALFGVLFSAYLTYLELFIILAICAWCLGSAVVMAILLTLSVAPVLEALSNM